MSFDFNQQTDNEKIYHKEYKLCEDAGKQDIEQIKKSIDSKISNEKINNTV